MTIHDRLMYFQRHLNHTIDAAYIGEDNNLVHVSGEIKQVMYDKSKRLVMVRLSREENGTDYFTVYEDEAVACRTCRELGAGSGSLQDSWVTPGNRGAEPGA